MSEPSKAAIATKDILVTVCVEKGILFVGSIEGQSVFLQEIQRAIDSAVTARTEQIAKWVDAHSYDWTLADRIRALPQVPDEA